MINTIFGTKQRMVEAYVGVNRVPVTRIDLVAMTVSQIKSFEKDGYTSTQVVFGKGKKNTSKALAGHLKKASVKAGQLREIEFSENQTVGAAISPADVVAPGAVVSIVGTAKGKGFAGAVKRWGFAGGPKTHGQSDRHRAPGSIGQGTTPGRVHRGKKMAGRMGGQTVTVKNALCVAASGNSIWVTGPVPGNMNGLIKIMVTGTKEVPELTFLKGYEKPVEKVASDAAQTDPELAEGSVAAPEVTEEKVPEETKE